MNHLGDTNKKVSETPRMDASAHDDGAIWETGCDIERELNKANAEIEEKRKDVVWLATEKAKLEERIKRLEEQLMDTKNKHAVLVADVVLNEDRAERIKRLEDRIHRAAMAFFRDGSDGHVASQMLQILEEERGKQ